MGSNGECPKQMGIKVKRRCSRIIPSGMKKKTEETHSIVHSVLFRSSIEMTLCKGYGLSMRNCAKWPTDGVIQFKDDFSVRYRPGLDLVLKVNNLFHKVFLFP